MTSLELLLMWLVFSVPVSLLVGRCMARQGKGSEQKAQRANEQPPVRSTGFGNEMMPQD